MQGGKKRHGRKILKLRRKKECEAFWERRDVIRSEVRKVSKTRREYN